MNTKLFLKFKIKLILIDLNQIFPMKPLGFQNVLSVKSYDKKTPENFRNSYVAEKRIVSKL